MKALLASCLLLASTSVPALAQKEIPKAEGHDQYPLGYVNTLGTVAIYGAMVKAAYLAG